MKTLLAVLRRRWPVVLGGSLAVCCLAAAVETAVNVPNLFNPTETSFQSQTHFLVFTGSDTAGEDAATAAAYYNAIDPSSSKRNFVQWLVKAGFIANASQWHPTGKQLIACNLPGCDLPAGTYGDNVINTDAHAIVLNAADLGFVRNQFIRCVPSCTASNPIIYTYLENYPVNPFANSFAGGSGFPVLTGYPTTAEATAAIQSALTRPAGTLPGCTQADTALGCSIQRIADVAFEWAPPAANPTSTFRYGQLYSFVFGTDANGNFTETIGWPGAPGVTPNVQTGLLEPFNTGDPFPPNLDFLGNKSHPGVCFICHGGNPKSLTISGTYPRQGIVNGFRLLPIDIRNMFFTSEAGVESTSRVAQDPAIKLYNQAVLKTVPTGLSVDEQGTARLAHLREVVIGWYQGYTGDVTMSGSTQQDYVPLGWREALGAPKGSEQLYKTVVGPSCRTCHFNRELSLDFGTAKNFDAYRSDILEYVLLPYCRAANPQPGMRPMPLAHLTYQRFWEANAQAQVLPYGQGGQLVLQSTADQVAQHFGYTSVAGYCATVH